MKFMITDAGFHTKIKNLVQEYPCLANFGLKEYDKNDEFGIIEVKSLNDLIWLQKAVKHDIIIGDYFLDKKVKTPLIIIYDDYME